MQNRQAKTYTEQNSHYTPHDAAQQVFADVATRLEKRGDCRSAHSRLQQAYNTFYIAMPVDADMTCSAARRRAFDYILLTLSKRPEYRSAHTIALELRNRYILQRLADDDGPVRRANKKPAPKPMPIDDDAPGWQNGTAQLYKVLIEQPLRNLARRAALLSVSFAIMCIAVYATADAMARQQAFESATACAHAGDRINKHASENGEVPPC